MDPFAHIQDVVGQLPFLKTYSHLLLAFPLADSDEARSSSVYDIQSAAVRLRAAIPWLSARVVNECSGSGNSGLFRLKPRSEHIDVRVHEAFDVCHTYDELLSAQGPATMLDGGLLAPCKAFPESYEDTDANPAPVLVFQINLIKGGILLDCAAQHNFIDMSGIEQCFNLLAMAMNGQPFPPEAIKAGNMDRRTLIPLLSQRKSAFDPRQFIRRLPSEQGPAPSEPDSPFSWCYFRFTAMKLADLKVLAMAKSGTSTETSVSTNDAVTAFCWKHVTTARLRRRQTPHAIAKLCRAVDARKTMGVPTEYMGDLVTIATSCMTFQGLADASLGDIAMTLRRDLNAVNNREYIRSFATFIADTADKSTIVYGGKFNPDTDIGCSSWARLGLSHVRFGSLGKPALIRRPTFGPLKSDIYFMPQTESGDTDALLCFNDADTKALRADDEWMKYADFIG
ncbi:hypothetical protein KCU92_g9111, partial [Aureobasidium melanogenum]